MAELRLVLCTVPERDSLRMAHAVVGEGLAACVNIVPTIRSVYVWKGAVNEDVESLLLIKTRADRLPDLTRFICDLHSYAVPEVIALAIGETEGNPKYLKWVTDTVGAGPGAD